MNITQSLFRLISAFLSFSVILTPLGTAKVGASTVTGFEPPPDRSAPRSGTAGGGESSCQKLFGSIS